MHENYVIVKKKKLIIGEYIKIIYCGITYTAQIMWDGFCIIPGVVPYTDSCWFFAKGYGVNIPEILLNDDPILLRLK